MKEKKIKVFFDGSCKVCSKEISFYNKYDKKKKFSGLTSIAKQRISKFLELIKSSYQNLYTFKWVMERF